MWADAVVRGYLLVVALQLVAALAVALAILFSKSDEPPDAYP